MSGGFTLSGGEALMQHRFAVKLLPRPCAPWASTPPSTRTATTATSSSDAELEVADLVILDIKCWDPERHRELTGMDIGPTLEFARRLAERRRPVWLRFVLVPGWTDDPSDVGRRRRVRGRPRQRGARRRAAVSPDGPLQVEGAGPRVQARGRRAAVGRGGREGVRGLPRGWAEGVLTASGTVRGAGSGVGRGDT